MSFREAARKDPYPDGGIMCTKKIETRQDEQLRAVGKTLPGVGKMRYVLSCSMSPAAVLLPSQG